MMVCVGYCMTCTMLHNLVVGCNPAAATLVETYTRLTDNGQRPLFFIYVQLEIC